MQKSFFISLVFVFILLMVISGCGEGTVDLTEAKYEPKIVIDGYLYPEQAVRNIRLTRNFPLNKDIDVSTVFLFNADVSITSLEDGKVYKLTFKPDDLGFGYEGNDLKIEYGKSYKLDVTAVVEGQTLHASSTTTVPQKGFKILTKDLGSMLYREKDAAGNIKNFNVISAPSQGSSFYALSVTALEASYDSFIFDNAFFTDIDSSDLEEDFDRFRQQNEWLIGVKDDAVTFNFDVEWHQVWFYGNYRLVVYAGDTNFKDFSLTHREVAEMDGTFHEPKLHIEGDGIGVFGSAIADTAYFSILK